MAADLREALERRLRNLGIATVTAEHPHDDVRLVLDAVLVEGGHEKFYFHPMTNSATMALSPDDFLKFMRSTGHNPIIVHFDEDIE